MAIGSAGLAARLEKQVSTTNRFKIFLSRYFYFGMSLVMAAVIVAGFSRTVSVNLLHANPPRPLLLWIHGVAFSTWVVFFIAQSGFVRIRQVAVHRFLGWFGVALATTMVALGTAVSIVMTRFDLTVLHQIGVDAFLSIPFADMLVFGTCVALAVYWRRRPEYHRRLLLIASCHLMDAGVGRFDFIFNNNIFYVCVDLLILFGMMRDWTVDGRVHKVYRYALPPIVVVQCIAVYLWRGNPVWWQGITHAILGL